MRFKKLLVLSALCLSASSVMATIVDGVRQKPQPSATMGFVASESTDTYYYLYNVDAKGFFTEGNAWGTQVSIGNKGLKVAFIVDSEYPDAYQFNDFSLAKNSWKLTFFDNEGAMFVDLGSQANYRWGVQENGETFRLFAASEENGNPGWDATVNAETGEETEHPAYREGLFVGWDSSSSGTACVPYLGEGEGHCINWAFVTEEVYTACISEIEVYESAQKLKKALDDAKAKGFNETAEYDALYLNEATPKEELEQALTKLNDAVVEWAANIASVESPSDMTSKIKNPSFDGDDLTTGWSTKFNANGGKENAEYWNMNYNTHQDIVGLPEGVYALGAKAFYRAGSNSSSALTNWLAHNEASKYAKLYATIGENTRETAIANVFSGAETEATGENGEPAGGDVKVTYTDENGEEAYYFVPNNMVRAEYFMHTLGKYDNKLMFSVGEGQTVTIGVKKDVNIGDEWSIFDDFTLTYYGKGADAYQLMLDEALKDYSDVTLDEGTLYTEALLDAYKAALAGEKTATNQAEVDAIFGAIDGAYNALQKNIELWQAYKKKVEDAHAKYSMDDRFAVYDEAGVLTDYIDADVKYVGDDDEGLPGYETIITEHALTNEELEAEMAFIDGLIAAVEKAAKEGLKEGQDVTIFLENPDFESGVKRDVANPNGLSGDYGTAVGWHADKLANGNFTPGPAGKDNDPSVNHAFEAWHCHDFDFWQEVDNLQEGVYVINVQGYVRNETGPNGSTVTEYDPSIIPIKLYMNKSTSNFHDVFSEEVDESHYQEDGTLPKIEDWSWNGAIENYPNSMGAAGMCFDWGMYKVETYGLVKQGETMRIGVKGKMTGDWWCIWDNFKLTYQGYNVNYVQPALDEAMANIDASKPMGKNVYSTAKGLADKAAEAKATGDGKTMFQMLADVYDAADDIRNSVELFAQLTDAIQNETTGLNAAIFVSANDQAKAEAEALVSTITGGIENYEYSDEDVAGLLKQIADMKTKLGMPAGWENATDENPADFTGVIVNPDYCNPENDMSYTTGWTNPGNPGNDNTQKSAQAMEFWETNFDMYQDLQGLPKGTYIVQLDAWCRNGASGENLDQFNLDNDTTLAFIYATGEDSVTFAAPVANLMKGAQTEDPGWEGIGLETLQEVDYYLPNSLVGGKAYMDPDAIAANEGVYTNKLIAKVGDDGKLRIGIKKDKKVTSSWVVLDNWKLFYCGSNSSLTPSPDITAVEAVNVEEAARVEFFSLDGRKANSAQKGVFIQKTTLSNGATIIKKIMK